MIVLARIDNRLIHGQVLESWVPHLHADCIVVANDKVAGVPFQKAIMEASVPSGIQVRIASLSDAVRAFDRHEFDGRRVLLLFGSSKDALEAYSQGLKFSGLNLGNMHDGHGKMRLTCTIALEKSDIENLKTLERSGVRIASQCVPLDKEQGLDKLLQGIGA